MKKNVSISVLVFLLCMVFYTNGFTEINEYDAVLSGFKKPDSIYAPMPLWWWVGEKIEKERLAWQLDQLKDKGVLNPCVIYSHAPGGFARGELLDVDPYPFTDEWWDIFTWTARECRKRGMSISFSEYTTFNTVKREIAQNHQELYGYSLGHNSFEIEGPEQTEKKMPNNIISVRAYRVTNGEISHENSIDLFKNINGGILKWQVPHGNWIV